MRTTLKLHLLQQYSIAIKIKKEFASELGGVCSPSLKMIIKFWLILEFVRRWSVLCWIWWERYEWGDIIATDGCAYRRAFNKPSVFLEWSFNTFTDLWIWKHNNNLKISWTKQLSYMLIHTMYIKMAYIYGSILGKGSNRVNMVVENYHTNL